MCRECGWGGSVCVWVGIMWVGECVGREYVWVGNVWVRNVCGWGSVCRECGWVGSVWVGIMWVGGVWIVSMKGGSICGCVGR